MNLVAVMTCHHHAEKVRAQRATWVPALRALGVRVHFFFGEPTGFMKLPAPDETWFYGVDDSYRGIPEKVRRIFGWAAERGYAHTMKCDDDVVIAPERFLSLPLDAGYIGRFRGPHGNYPAHFASGFAYWLGINEAKIVASTPSNGDWMDERFVANALARHGVFGYNDPVNYLVTGPHISGADILKRPILQAGTVFCEYRAEQMREVYDAVRSAQPVGGHPGLRQVPHVVVTDEILSAPPKDSIPSRKLERYYGR